jgi:hypothetical protein
LERREVNASQKNFVGASDRPKLEEVWKKALAKEKGEEVTSKGYTITTPLGLLCQKILK